MNKKEKENLKKEILQNIGYAIFNKKHTEWQHENGKTTISFEEFKKLQKKVITILDHINVKSIQTKKKLFTKKIIITLFLERPGIFIGKKGELINHVQIFLNKESKYEYEIKLKESKINNHLYLCCTDLSDIL